MDGVSRREIDGVIYEGRRGGVGHADAFAIGLEFQEAAFGLHQQHRSARPRIEELSGGDVHAANGYVHAFVGVFLARHGEYLADVGIGAVQ